MVEFTGTHSFPKQGICIYCGSPHYAEGTSRRLGDEHTIPQTIGGVFLLPHAVCRQCEVTTNLTENALYRGGFASVKRHFKFKGKKRSNRKDRSFIPIFDCSDPDNQVRIDVPADEYPGILLLMVPPAPKLINASWEPKCDIWSHWVNAGPLKAHGPNRKSIFDKYGTSKIALVSTNMLAHARAIAKIAHSTAIGLFGANSFDPLLTDFILGRDDDNCYAFVGRSLLLEKHEAEIHIVDYREVSVLGVRYLVARVRLFACLGSPSFDVVTGLLKPELERIEHARIAQHTPPDCDLCVGPVQSFDPRTHKPVSNLPNITARDMSIPHQPAFFRVVINFSE